MTALTEETARELIDKIDRLLAAFAPKGGGKPRARVPVPEALPQRIRDVLLDSPVEMSRRDIVRKLGAKYRGAEIATAIQDLVDDGWLYSYTVQPDSGGRPTVRVGLDGIHAGPSE